MARLARRDLLAALGGMAACAGAGFPALAQSAPKEPAAPKPGVMRIDPEIDAIFEADSEVDIVATGYKWAEGPAWVPQGDYLLFNDPPNNIMYRWSAREGVAPFLRPSGLQGPVPAGIREAGANGIGLDAQGRLLIADSGTRAVVRLDLKTRARTVVADRYAGKRFNSPNDLVVARSGAIYFSDPPYGLAEADASPLRELDFNGLYRIAPDGKVDLLDRTHRRPNGVGLSPDQRTLYLALSDEQRPEILAYALDEKGFPTGVRLFHDMRPHFAQGLPGLPDGMKVDGRGYVFATGPGGVHVCAPDGRLLGIVATGKAVANCAIGENGTTLFLTSHDMLCRVPLKRA